MNPVPPSRQILLTFTGFPVGSSTPAEGAQFTTRLRAGGAPRPEGLALTVAPSISPELILAYLAVGLVAGVLAGLLGVGGGLVIVPALIWTYRLLGIDGTLVAHLAIGTSLATIVVTSLSAIRAHHRRGAVRWALAGRLAPGMVAGAWIGALLANRLSGVWLQRVFAGFLLLIGLRMLFELAPRPRRALPGPIGLSAAGFGIGAISALVGVGGGSLTVPFLSRCGVSIRNAVATSSACGLPIALAGAVGYLALGWGDGRLPAGATGFIYWPAVFGVTLASAASAPLGAWLAHDLPVVALRRVFAVLLLGIALKMLA